MENQEVYKPIDCGFHDWMEAVAVQKKYVKVQYFTEIHELITLHTLIKDWVNEFGVEYMLLAGGEKIRMDRIMSIDGKFSPRYTEYDDYSCDC
jgi:Rho-binding antiterminator